MSILIFAAGLALGWLGMKALNHTQADSWGEDR